MPLFIDIPLFSNVNKISAVFNMWTSFDCCNNLGAYQFMLIVYDEHFLICCKIKVDQTMTVSKANILK